jgi:polyhydroxyalkanoate synthase
MVVANKGHIQTVVSAIENSRQKYWAGAATASGPDDWLNSTEQYSGSWWPRWGDWLTERSGADHPAPVELGGTAYPAREHAPGRYVLE